MRVWTYMADTVVIKAFQELNWNRMMGPTASKWTDEELAQKMATTPMPERREQWRRVARQPYTEGEIKRAADVLRHVLERMEASLERGPWLAGSTFSLADINMSPYAVRFGELEEHGMFLRDYPRTHAWWAARKSNGRRSRAPRSSR